MAMFLNNQSAKKHAILKLYIEDENWRSFYKNKVLEHNMNIIGTPYPVSGFNLYIPRAQDVDGNESVTVDMKIRCSMTSDVAYNGDFVPVGFYLRSHPSLSITPMRFVNGSNIVNSGYRRSIISIFDNLSRETHLMEKHSPIAQICSPDLRPIIVELVDSIHSLGPGEDDITHVYH